MTDRRTNRKTNRKAWNAIATRNREEWPPLSQANQSRSDDDDDEDNTSLHGTILNTSGWDNNQQLTEVKEELHKTNNRFEEGEGRIKEA